MAKKDQESQQNSEQQQEGETNQLNQEVSEPSTPQDAEKAEQESGGDENRVVNNGDVSDPGNSGLVGEAFTEGSVTGNADKPNG